jgi:hypothetical protein
MVRGERELERRTSPPKGLREIQWSVWSWRTDDKTARTGLIQGGVVPTSYYIPYRPVKSIRSLI